MHKIIIYTDGACSNNQDQSQSIGGWAYYLEYQGKTKTNSGQELNTTNNRMEMLAVINALKALKRFDLPVAVHTDSALVCNTINLGWKRKSNLDLWDQLDQLLIKFDDLTFIKVKGHSDDRLNNLVDQLAVKATKK
jgi:ribonuclease HI